MSGDYPALSVTDRRFARELRLLHRNLVFVVHAREEGGEAFDGHLEVGVQVDEDLKLAGQPREADLFVAASGHQFFDAAIGEVHEATMKRRRRARRGRVARARGRASIRWQGPSWLGE